MPADIDPSTASVSELAAGHGAGRFVECALGASLPGAYQPLSRYTRPINYLGLCALAVPCGFDSNGLPISVQFVGGPGSEAALINIGTAYEQARGPFPAPICQALPGVPARG